MNTTEVNLTAVTAEVNLTGQRETTITTPLRQIYEMSVQNSLRGVLGALVLASVCLAQQSFESLPAASAGLRGDEIRLQRTTMNFELTSNINQTVNEQTDNEKEVEIGDVDNDGDYDVVIVSARSFFSAGARRNKLYINDNGVFNEVTAKRIQGFTNVDVSRNGFLRDYDHDGWLDIIVVNDAIAGPARGTTRFYANKHPGGVFSHFEDETNRLNGAVGDACGGFLADFNGDGNEDLYLGNYPNDAQDTMYYNNGVGSCTHVTAANVPTARDYTVDVASADLNGDGKIDMLVSNDGDPAYIYYNDNQGAGSGPGDFRYPNSTTTFSAQNGLYPALEPGDFNGDGRMDFYFANRGPTADDALMINTGNDSNNKAVFSPITVPGIASTSPTAKVIVSDLNRDRRPDLIVMGGDTLFQSEPSRRTVIFRNTSHAGQTSFVEWSPAPAFPSDASRAGWHAAAFDANKDGRKDIFIGAMNDDFLLRGKMTTVLRESEINGNLPSFNNKEPLAIAGRNRPQSPGRFVASILGGATVSAVLQSSADVSLTVYNSSGTMIVNSDRGGAGVEEALQFTAPGGALTFEVANTSERGGSSYLLELLSRSN